MGRLDDPRGERDKELLRSGAYRCLDREAKGADPEKIQREAFSCDTYFCSSNAVTEAGSSITSTASATAWPR